MKKVVAIALIMLGIGILGAFFSFEWKDIKNFGTEPVFEEKVIDSAAVGVIFAETKSMDVEVVRGNTDDIKVRIEGKASKKYLDRFKLEAEAKGDAVYINASYKDSLIVGFNIIDVDLVVELPERLWSSIDIKSNYGNIDIEQLNTASAAIEAGSGNVNIEHLQADATILELDYGNVEIEDLNAKTATVTAKSGNIKVENYVITEQITVRANSGNVRLEDGTGSLHAETGSGNIRLIADELLQDVILRSDSGNVRIDVEKEPDSATLNLRTSFGSRDVDWKAFQADNDNEQQLSGKIGDGKMKIDVEIGSGNLKLSRS